MTGTGASAGAVAPQWLALTLRWGPAEIPLQSNSPQVLSWTRDCFTAERPVAPAGHSTATPAAVVVDDELARRLANACGEPVPGTEMPAQSGAAEGMLLVRPVTLVRPQLRSSWDLLPFPAGVTAERRFGSADGGLATVLERVPVLQVRWRPGRDDPSGVIAALRDRLS